MTKARASYPSDVTDDEWAFCAPSLTLMKADAPQRKYELRTRYFTRPNGDFDSLMEWHCVSEIGAGSLVIE